MKTRSRLPNLSSHLVLGALILAEGVVSVASAHPLQSEVGSTLFVAALETAGGPRTATVRAAAPLALLFRHEAERLYSKPSRWRDAAVLQVQSAGLTEAPRRRGDDLLTAANIFYQRGEGRTACTILAVAVESGGIVDSHRESFASGRNQWTKTSETLIGIARRSSEIGCSDDWDEFLEDLVVPAPEAGVRVAPPYVPPQVRLATQVEPLVAFPLEAPMLEAPPLDSRRSALAEVWGADGIVDAPEIEIRVAVPEVPRVLDLEGPRLEAPVLEAPELGPPPLSHR